MRELTKEQVEKRLAAPNGSETLFAEAEAAFDAAWALFRVKGYQETSLQDILARDGSLDTRERQARLQKLEQELNREPEGEGITVVLEGEADGFAG